MGEVKSVKVDNWGVFFLQKLQNFFNKTDYCDLTLQFRDNSQLKVHRLVLSACTDYFNVLEQTCEIVDDALIMPNEFQADVVVPIVNFMYTGTLEFELKMYGKLLRTAKEMNMTVLLKLLEAHRRTMENVNRAHRPPSPKGIRRSRGPLQISPQRSVSTLPQHRNTAVQVQQIRSISANTGMAQRSPNSSVLRTNAGMGQNSRAEYEPAQQQIKQEPTSPFEQLRKGYNNNKRPTNTVALSPPAKKPNLEDVKEFAEQQRMRKQIAAEYGEDQEYEGMMDDDVHADDDDDEAPQQQSQPSTSKQVDTTIQTTRVEHGGATIIFKQESPDQQPTIIVKDSSSTKLNHAKIIAEVLRQYPHLMKGQKNIKLKIMPNTPHAPLASTASATGQAQKVIKKEPEEVSRAAGPQKRVQPTTRSVLAAGGAKAATSAQTQTTQQKVALPSQKVIGTQAAQALPASTVAAAASAVQKRRIDSKTMHALIALGAENTTGPWLCLRCGVNNRPISIPSYRGFRRHLVNTHKESIDPALCEFCGWRSQDERNLHYHMRVEHKVSTGAYTFPECTICNELFLKYDLLNTHLDEVHANSKQQCIYCNRLFAKELQLYTHMKTQHKEQALEDGIIDETDDEYIGDGGSQDEMDTHFKKVSKVKILSDISLPNATSIVNLESAHTSQTEPEVTQVEEYLHTATTSESEIKFVGPDGNEVQLTEEQRKEILSQLNQQEHGSVVMVLNETSGNEDQEQEQEQDQHQSAKAETDSATDVKSAAGTEESLGDDELNEEGDVDASSMAEDYDDSQIYTELNSQSATSEDKKSVSAHLDESKESIDNLEWAENLISEHERETSSTSESKSKKANLSDKLKELTCDWTEDENEDDSMEVGDTKTEPEKSTIDSKNENKADKPTKTQPCDSEIKSRDVAETKKGDEKTNATQEEDQEEEDDIDLALHNLHKESSPVVKNIEHIQEAASTAKAESVNEVDTVDKIKAVAGEVTKEIEIKEEPSEDATVPEEFMKESSVKPLLKLAVTKDKTDKTAEPDNDGDDLQKERDNIKRTLLDELIAEADNPKNELHDETSTGLDKLGSVEATVEEEVEKEVAKVTEATLEKVDTASDVAAANTKGNDSSADAAGKSEAAQSNEEVKPTTSGEGSGTAEGTDKVKSIISEWGADDEDDDDDKVKEEL